MNEKKEIKEKKFKNYESNLMNFAQSELKIAGLFDDDSDYNGAIATAIMELMNVFSKQEHSGFSGSMVIDLFKKLAKFQPITPIMGTDDEWTDCEDNLYQNKRCSAIFKNGKDGEPYYIDAIVWQGEEGWDNFTGCINKYKSFQHIKSFPFVPKTFYVDVIKEMLPDDYNDGPFVECENSCDKKEFELIGEKNCKKKKYRYVIKDENQMKEVFEYYKENP
jgi:hypothetical protein